MKPLSLYDYLKEQLEKTPWLSEWTIEKNDRVKELTVQFYLPLKALLSEEELHVVWNTLGDTITSYLIQLQFNEVVDQAANKTGYYFFTPEMYAGQYTKTDIDVILSALHTLEVSAVSQFRDLAHHERQSLSLPWPSAFEAERKRQLALAGRVESLTVKGW
ncbi:MAG: hypothetical protein Q4A67_00610 [Aerococcus sp.]|nr:hypothetical protein [Aerococcus sp.]